MKQWKLQNTYFVAKNLSERLVMSYDRKPFPVCIMRPSLIGCVAGNPFPGFIGNTSGFTALILGTLAGQVLFFPPFLGQPNNVFRHCSGAMPGCLGLPKVGGGLPSCGSKGGSQSEVLLVLY